jgi:hypothetical protein
LPAGHSRLSLPPISVKRNRFSVSHRGSNGGQMKRATNGHDVMASNESC